ncbi:RN213-like protein, partial [Mya arenaria]
MGKSLYIQRKSEEFRTKFQKRENIKTDIITIRACGKTVDIKTVVEQLLKIPMNPKMKSSIFFHIDIPPEVDRGIDHLLFNLTMLNTLTDENGYVWRRSVSDMYFIEAMAFKQWEESGSA